MSPTAITARARVVVPTDPDRAFTLFTRDISLWWQRDGRYWNDPSRAVLIRLEPGLDGRLIEVYDAGTGEGYEVGRVTVWQPGRHLRMTWRQRSWPSDAHTHVDVHFRAADQGTEITLVHAGLETVDARGDACDHEAGWREILGWLSDHVHRELRPDTRANGRGWLAHTPTKSTNSRR